nr:acetyltransferase [Streptococcus oralis]
EQARILTRKLNETPEVHLKERSEIVKELFGTTGDNIHLESSFRCDYGYNIHVGENFYANFDCTILDVCPVTIGVN